MSIPTGTVTFLFTDIEGSTRLAREHAEKWERLRARHHEILQAAIDGCNGYVFQVIGDAFCAAFHRPGDAVNAAVLAQQGLQGETWGDTVIRVRMGVHTGEAEFDGKDYRGYLTMSLVQRLMSAGHGGQVLVSGASEHLLHGQLSGDVYLQDIGRHHFKDVPQPERIFQVVAPILQKEFPPIRTIDHHPNNLPPQLTSFVGREKERADIRKLLHSAHMLTLIGPGGTGKTRLSIQAASEMLDAYPDGVWLVELAPILDPLLVPRTTAVTIGLRDEPQRPVIDMLCDYLHERKMLILLDNCEHLVDACARVADRILHAAPNVLILASSREALGIGGEVTYRVPSLGLPDLANLPSVETLDQYEAVRLFIDRATSGDPSFSVTNENAPAVAQICHRLDGIPLAIELAAAKIRVLGVDQIAKRLDDRFKLLTGGSRTALERHQTLRAAIDWSFNLLPLDEQVLFRKLSVFVSGWTLEAAESVCSDGMVKSDDVLDLLEHLIHKSVVLREEQKGTSRYRMLETIRQYANEKLIESGDGNTLRDRHLEYFLDLAETAEPHLVRPEQLEWLSLLDAETENLRAALEWALGKEAAEPSLRLSGALGQFWSIRDRWREGTGSLAQALSKMAHDEDPRERAARVKALYRDSELAEHQDDIARQENSARLSLTLAERGSSALDTAIATFYLGFGVACRGRMAEARPLLEQCLKDFERLDHPYWQARAYLQLGYILVGNGELKDSQRRSNYSELARRSGDRLTSAIGLLESAEWHYLHAKIDEAGQYLKQADILYKEMGQEKNNSAIYSALVAWLAGDIEQARSNLLEYQLHLKLLGEKETRSRQLILLGWLAMEEGDFQQSLAWLDEALGMVKEIEDKFGMALCLAELGKHANLQDDFEKFKQNFMECLAVRRELDRYHSTYLLFALIGCPYFQKPEHSLPLLSAIASQSRQREILIDPRSKRSYDRAEAAARAALGDVEFEAACAQGAQLSIDEALDLMLQKVEKL